MAALLQKYARRAAGLFAAACCVAMAVAQAGRAPRFAAPNAPVVARTASTLLLLWEPPEPPAAGTVSYEIVCDGIAGGTTRGTSFLVQDLEAGHRYRFAIRARDARGGVVAESAALETATKVAGGVLNVRARGARGDGQQDDTGAIQQAIDDCPAGGTVLVPAGEYAIERLALRSDFTLHLAAGAVLRLQGRVPDRFREQTLELSGPDGPVAVACGALITGFHCENVAITGEGTVAGNGATWWPHAAAYRPKLLELVDARHVLIQGITLEDPPFWNTHLLYVDDAVVSHVTFLKRSTAAGSNGDGLDPDSCRGVVVAGCAFGNQDDSIAVKSGKLTATQSRRQRPCENITVRDCRFDGTLAPGSHPLGIGLGSETCGGVRGVRVRGCAFVNAASLINIKGNRDRRQARVEDVVVEDCTYVNDVFPDEPWNRAPITLDLFYYSRGEDPDEPRAPTGGEPLFRDIHFRRLTITNPKGRAVFVSGLPEQPVQDITFATVTARAQRGFFARNVDGLALAQVTVEVAEGPAFEWGGGLRNVAAPAPSAPLARP